MSQKKKKINISSVVVKIADNLYIYIFTYIVSVCVFMPFHILQIIFEAISEQ